MRYSLSIPRVGTFCPRALSQSRRHLRIHKMRHQRHPHSSLVLGLFIASFLPTAFSLPTHLTEKTDCKAIPITLEIRNVSLSSNTISSKGIPALFGRSRQQAFGLKLTTLHDETRLKDADGCGNEVDVDKEVERCIAESAGVYDKKSPDFRAATKAQVNGTDSVVFTLNRPNGKPIRDRIDDYSISIIQPLDEQPSTLGLGRNSTFIKTLLGQDYIHSPIWSLRMGSSSASDPSAGSLTLGGFDTTALRPGSNWTTFPISSSGCPFKVRLESLTLYSQAGTGRNLLQGQSEEEFCIDMQDTAIKLSPSVFGNLASSISPALYLSSPRRTRFPAEFETAMDSLEIEFEGGYKSRVRRDELVGRPREVNSAGRLVFESFTTPHLETILTATGSDDTPTLGGAFLAGNILLVDYAAGEFHLAPANPLYDPLLQKMQTICSPRTRTVDYDDNERTKLELILGGTLVGVVGLATIIAGVYYLWYLPWKRDREEGGNWKRLLGGEKSVGTVAAVGAGQLGVAGIGAAIR